MSTEIEQKQPIDLPLSSLDLRRAGKRRYNVNDDVEGLVRELYDDPQEGDKFRKLLYGAENGKFSYTGRVDWDDFLAAQMIQAYAKKINPNSFVALASLETVFRAYRVVVNRRYPELSRKQRRLALYSGNGQ